MLVVLIKDLRQQLARAVYLFSNMVLRIVARLTHLFNETRILNTTE